MQHRRRRSGGDGDDNGSWRVRELDLSAVKVGDDPTIINQAIEDGAMVELKSLILSEESGMSVDHFRNLMASFRKAGTMAPSLHKFDIPFIRFKAVNQRVEMKKNIPRGIPGSSRVLHLGRAPIGC